MTPEKRAAMIAEVEKLPPGRFVPVQTLAHSFTREELLEILRTTATPVDVELERVQRIETELAASRTQATELLAFVQSSPCECTCPDTLHLIRCRRCELLENKS